MHLPAIVSLAAGLAAIFPALYVMVATGAQPAIRKHRAAGRDTERSVGEQGEGQ